MIQNNKEEEDAKIDRNFNTLMDFKEKISEMNKK